MIVNTTISHDQLQDCFAKATIENVTDMQYIQEHLQEAIFIIAVLKERSDSKDIETEEVYFALRKAAVFFTAMERNCSG